MIYNLYLSIILTVFSVYRGLTLTTLLNFVKINVFACMLSSMARANRLLKSYLKQVS